LRFISELNSNLTKPWNRVCVDIAASSNKVQKLSKPEHNRSTLKTGEKIMIPNFKLSLLATALVMTPLAASAGHCRSDMVYKKHGYYDHPHHHHYLKHPMHRSHYYPGHPKMDWHHDKPNRYKKSYKSDSRAKEPQSGAKDLGAAPTGSIVETAISAGNFNTLVSAIESAGLVEILNDTGPFTVFAPSDEAFEKIPESIRAAIIADKDALADLLSYHVVSGEVTAADVAKLDYATTVQGSSVTFDTSDGVKVDGANVVATDIRATNGIIHVIDTVMVPN
jgi:uncharacterized surface protein with fasciclin (FAS1) repeats